MALHDDVITTDRRMRIDGGGTHRIRLDGEWWPGPACEVGHCAVNISDGDNLLVITFDREGEDQDYYVYVNEYGIYAVDANTDININKDEQAEYCAWAWLMFLTYYEKREEAAEWVENQS